MSDTPETDAAIKSQSEWKLPFVSYTMGGVTYDGPVATLCRKLERERDEAIKKICRLEKQIEGSNNFANERFEEIQRVRRERDEAREKAAQWERISIRLDNERTKLREIAERAIDYLNQSYRNGFEDEANELRVELDQLKEGGK